jgi:hypothetical protein
MGSQLPETIHDVPNQFYIHWARTFQREFLAFLKRPDINFDGKLSVGLTMTSTGPSGTKAIRLSERVPIFLVLTG